MREVARAQDAFQPVERIEGAFDRGAAGGCRASAGNGAAA
jgi:hypothetical protein